jgi:plastocyanin
MIRSIPLAVLAVALGAAAGCGGDSGSPSPSPGPGTGTIAATITITAAGASPRDVTIAPGSRVTFVNNDTRNHDMQSDPHPEHTDCPAMAQVGFLAPGQSKTSGNFNTTRTCGFHDHNLPEVASLQGAIRVQ